jgi:hypothetical protein
LSSLAGPNQFPCLQWGLHLPPRPRGGWHQAEPGGPLYEGGSPIGEEEPRVWAVVVGRHHDGVVVPTGGETAMAYSVPATSREPANLATRGQFPFGTDALGTVVAASTSSGLCEGASETTPSNSTL